MSKIGSHENMHGQDSVARRRVAGTRQVDIQQQHSYAPDSSKRSQCPQGRVAHSLGLCGSDIDAVPCKGGTSDNRHQEQPRQKVLRCFYYCSIRCHDFHHRHSCKMVYQYEYQSNTHTPNERPFNGLAEHQKIFRSYETACQSLTGICKSVSEIREQQQKFHYYGTYSQKKISVARRYGRKTDINRYHADRTDEQVGIHRKEFPCFCSLEKGFQVRTMKLGKSTASIFESKNERYYRKPGPLCRKRSYCHSVKTHRWYDVDSIYCQSKRKSNAQEYIHAIHGHIGSHRADTVLHTYEPALKGHQRQSSRSSPDTDHEIS